MKGKVKVIVILAMVLLLGNLPVFGLLAGNESEIAYINTNSGKRTTINTVDTLKRLIVQGGAYSLQSAADFNRFLSAFELSEVEGLDLNQLQSILADCASNLGTTRELYKELSELAAATPYNTTTITKLQNYNYYALMQSRGLNPTVFYRVWWFLGYGDVNGVYSDFYSQTNHLYQKVRSLQNDINAGLMPELSEVWRLSQEFVELKLFGQYVAEVFFSL